MSWAGLAATMIAPVSLAGSGGDAVASSTGPGAIEAEFMARWQWAEVRLGVAESLTCGRVYRARELDRLRDRLELTIARAGVEFGRPLLPMVLLLEPWHGDRPCGEYRDAVIAARHALEDLEARLPSARTETVQ